MSKAKARGLERRASWAQSISAEACAAGARVEEPIGALIIADHDGFSLSHVSCLRLCLASACHCERRLLSNMGSPHPGHPLLLSILLN